MAKLHVRVIKQNKISKRENQRGWLKRRKIQEKAAGNWNGDESDVQCSIETYYWVSKINDK
jgi:hypothetical protein